jgi:hypothetical protein
MRLPKQLTEAQEREIVGLYKDKATATDEIAKAYGIGQSRLYQILRERNIPLRGRGKDSSVSLTLPTAWQAVNGNGNGKANLRPSRVWYLLEECVAITGMDEPDITHLIRKGKVYAENSQDGTHVLIYMPSLLSANQYGQIDQQRAAELLCTAYELALKVGTNRGIDTYDFKQLAADIQAFLKGYGLL